MNENENRKDNVTLENDGGVIDEALPDGALENVAGGVYRDWLKGLFVDPAGNESSDSPPTGQGGTL